MHLNNAVETNDLMLNSTWRALTHWSLWDVDAILKLQFSISFYWLVSSHRLRIMPLRWMPWDLTDDKSPLVQVMAWCRQATSHYLSQCWPSAMPPYGVTRPIEWVAVAKLLCSRSGIIISHAISAATENIFLIFSIKKKSTYSEKLPNQRLFYMRSATYNNNNMLKRMALHGTIKTN